MATVPVSDFVSGKHKVYGPDGSSFVTCGCGSKKSAPAVQWLTKITSCPGKCEQNTAWLQTFQIKEIAAPVKGKTPKKSAESSSKATTPTKDGDSADKAVSDEEVKQKKSAKKQKVDKEPKAPKSKTPTAKADEGEAKTKRPAGAYFVFCEAKRAEAKEANAEKALAAKELGEMWKALSEEEKEPYTTKAKQLKADYDEVKCQTESGKKKAAKAEGPKKARTAYMIFSEYIRPQILEEFPGIQAKEVMKLQGPKWKELSAEDKKIWEDKAKEEKENLAAGGEKEAAAGSKRKAPESAEDGADAEEAEKNAEDAADAETSEEPEKNSEEDAEEDGAEEEREEEEQEEGKEEDE